MVPLLLLACAPADPDAARLSWMRQVITEDNRVWLARAPELVAGKYRRMDADPYDFLRGTAAFWVADLSRPDPDRAPTRFLIEPDAAAVLVVGDPHLENLGTTLPGDEPDPGDADPFAPIPLEWVDLDGAAFGPWTLDARRAALSLALVADGLDVCGDGTEPCAPLVVAAFAEVYVAELRTRASGGSGWDAAAELPESGRHVAQVRALARREGVAGSAVADATVSGGRRDGRTGHLLELDAGLDDNDKGVLPLTESESAQLNRLLASWTEGRPADFRMLDAGRRFGSGIASFPAIRFLVLYDLGRDGPQDDRLLNLREVVDPPGLPTLDAGFPAPFLDNADRVITASHRLWSRTDADARAGALRDGSSGFKSSTVSGWYTTFDHADLYESVVDGSASPEDLLGVGRTVGRALASAHARSFTANGDPALAVVVADLDAGGGDEVFVAERVRDAAADLARLQADAVLFHQALEYTGELLGAEVLLP